MEKIGLGTLLAPLTPEAFFESHWPRRPLFIPASRGKLGALLELPQLEDVRSVIAARTSTVRACLPDHDDEYSSILVEPGDALKVFQNKMTLVFDAMQAQCPEIADALEQVRSDLGLVPELTEARAIAYATPAGGRTRLHFDANANFVVQLRGTKRWGLAPNTSVDNPTDRYTTGTLEIAPALERQCHAPLLDQLPEGSPEFLMEPGCVLFVPRGHWHETSTTEDSLSLTFAFSQPTWADVFATALREHLVGSAEWRALADGLEGPSPERQEAAIARFDHLLAQLSRQLPGMSVRDLLGSGS